jgi:phospholipid/cholesterol/gamma-HCH transport system substrate-binding protein
VPFRAPRWRDLIPGAVVIAALAALTAATLKYARIGALHGDTVRYYAAFASARNVMGGTEVWINGTKVGRVRSVHFATPSADTSSRVIVELDVLAKYRDQIRQNSTARLGTGTRIMGPTIVAITVGSRDARIVPANDTIRGSAGADVQALTESFGEVEQAMPTIVANVKVLSSSLASTRGTLGALTTLDAPKRLEALVDNASRLSERATSGDGTIALALKRGELIARAKAAAAQADSVRLLLASDRTSLGRFRRDSTLIRAVADLRDELSITSALLSSQSGSLARFGQDSIIAIQMAEMSKQMTELFADIKKRPFRYIAF